MYAAIARDARVFAFEPEAANLAGLQRNIVLNGLSTRLTPYALAVAGDDGLDTLKLHGPTLRSGNALHAFGAAVDYAGAAFEPVAIQGIFGLTLDSLVEHWKLPAPQHVKIDVDGLEPAILSGAAHILAGAILRTIFVEIELGHEGMDHTLQSHGFSLVRKEPSIFAGNVVAHNCVFTR